MPSTVFKSKRHSTAVSPSGTFTPPTGLDWDLTDATSVTLIARIPGSIEPKISRPCVVTGPWSFRFDPEPADVDTIGAYDVEFDIVLANSRKATFPTEGYLSWVIGPDLDDS